MGEPHALWTLGLILEQVGSRSWPCSCRAPGGPAQLAVNRWAIAGAFAVTLAGRGRGALVDPTPATSLSILPSTRASPTRSTGRRSARSPLITMVVVLALLVLRLRGCRFTARRSR